MPREQSWMHCGNFDLKTHAANLLRTIKPIIGLTLLGLVVLWIANNDHLWTRISTEALVYSTLVSGITVGLNAIILRLSVEYYGASLSYANALRLSALGTLGNALGGLPIGTALKYGLLYKKSGLRAGEITTGLMIFSFATSCWLLASASLSAQSTSLATSIKFAVPLLLCVGIAALIFLSRWAKHSEYFGRLVKPFLLPANFQRVLLVSLAVTATFVINYLVVGGLLYPDVSLSIIVFVASIGTFISLGSVLQSVGGVTELSLAVSSLFSGLDAVTGATLALVLRLTAIIAACATLAGLSLRSTRNRD